MARPQSQIGKICWAHDETTCDQHTFSDLIHGGCQYVDKTAGIYELIREYKGVAFDPETNPPAAPDARIRAPVCEVHRTVLAHGGIGEPFHRPTPGNGASPPDGRPLSPHGRKRYPPPVRKRSTLVKRLRSAAGGNHGPAGRLGRQGQGPGLQSVIELPSTALHERQSP